MTVTLLVIAMIAAANPFRARAARPDTSIRESVGAAFGATLVLAWMSALASGPLLDLVDVSGPSARIAAGIALLVVALKDVFMGPPKPAPALPGWKGGILPLAFPVIFSPAFALLAVAGSAERGVVVAVGAAALALVPVAATTLLAPARRLRLAATTIGVAGVGIATLVVLDGVYAI